METLCNNLYTLSIFTLAYVYFYLHPQANKLTSPNELFL
jgi:hypothetical protein